MKATKPYLTIARDIVDQTNLDRILDEAYELNCYADYVVVVPKDPLLSENINEKIPGQFILGYSVPTKYGFTSIDPKKFRRPVHLLGGRPDIQLKMAEYMQVISLDCNRFTLDAKYGDYFDGEKITKHPHGGYMRCIEDSIININNAWRSYEISGESLS